MEVPDKFSDEHSFSRAQIEAAAGLVAIEARPKRWLIGVTQGYRTLAQRQFLANQLAFVVAVPSIFLTQWIEGAVDHDVLIKWSGVALLMFVLRLLAAKPLFVQSPAVVAGSILLRTMPLVMALTAAVFWAVSAFLFIGQQFQLSTVVMIVAFIALSIPMAGMGPSVPIASGIYIATLWTSMIMRLLQLPTVPGIVAFTIVALVVVCLVVTLVVVLQVRSRLERADRIDLLTAGLMQSNAELEVVRSKLATTIRRRSTFFAAANHDFRQRLHALKVLSATSLADRSLNDSSARALRTLSEEVQNLDLYLTDILDFARIETMSPRPELRRCALQRIFQDVNLHFEALADSRAVELRVRPTQVELRTDPAMLQRMVENLVSNAVKFTRGTVLVSARRASGRLRIEVWDRGPGIPQDGLQNIFEAFHQLEGDEPVENRGVGLGLAVVRRFAEALGYQVSVRSNLGRGSVFRIEVPADALVS